MKIKIVIINHNGRQINMDEKHRLLLEHDGSWALYEDEIKSDNIIACSEDDDELYINIEKE